MLKRVLGGQSFEWDAKMTMYDFVEKNRSFYEEKLVESEISREFLTYDTAIEKYASEISETMSEIYIDYIND